MGGGEIALLRHLDHSRVPSDRLTVALLNPGPLVDAVRARGVVCGVVGREDRDGAYPGFGETLQIGWRLAGLIRRRRVTSVLCYTIPDLQAAMWARRFLRFNLAWRSQGEATVTTLKPDEDRRLSRLIRAVPPPGRSRPTDDGSRRRRTGSPGRGRGSGAHGLPRRR